MALVINELLIENKKLEVRVSQASQDPDFDLAEGSHQVVKLCILIQ
jgi:hypothetical protein